MTQLRSFDHGTCGEAKGKLCSRVLALARSSLLDRRFSASLVPPMVNPEGPPLLTP